MTLIQRRTLHDEEVAENVSIARSIVSGASTVVTAVARGISHWKIILFGQFMAVLLTLRGALNALASRDCGLNAPAFQISIMYGMLMLHLVYYSAQQRRSLRLETRNSLGSNTLSTGASDEEESVILTGKKTSDKKSSTPKAPSGYSLPFAKMSLQNPWWLYFILAMLDVQANYFSYLSLRFTAFKSAALLDDCLTVPAAMLSSRIILRRQYTCVHLLGASICMVGALMVVFSDYEDDLGNEQDGTAEGQPEYKTNGPTNVLMGDIFAACGGVLYGVMDSLSEKALKNSGETEYLGMLGLFGFFIAGTQAVFLEWEEVFEIFSGSSSCTVGTGILLYAGIVGTFYVYYVALAKFLVISEAALFNLSLQSSNAWAFVFAFVEEHEVPSTLLYSSLGIIISGVFIYEMAPSPIVDTTDAQGEHMVELPPSFTIA